MVCELIQRAGVGQLGNSRGFPTGEVDGRSREVPFVGVSLTKPSCGGIRCYGCPCLLSPSGWNQSACWTRPPFGSGEGAGEELDRHWSRGKTSVGKGDRVQVQNPMGHTGWQGSAGWGPSTSKGGQVMALPGFLQGTWEMLEVFVPSPVGNCYSPQRVGTWNCCSL